MSNPFAELTLPTMSAMRMVKSPSGMRWCSLMLLLGLIALPFALLFVPWQQTVFASGKVIAYLPSERPQAIDSPIDGRVQNWYVFEGKSVKKGDKIVELQDVDPDFLTRLKEQLRAAKEREQAARQRVQRFGTQITSLIEAREKAISAATKRAESAERVVESSKAAVTRAEAMERFEDTNYQAQKKLFEDNRGLASGLDYQRAYRNFEAAKASVAQAKENLLKDESLYQASLAEIERVKSNDAATIEIARANQESANAEVAAAEQLGYDLQVRISRQGAQSVLAPCDGMIQRVVVRAGAGGEMVKAGETLVEFVPTTGQYPDSKGLVVELLINGLDTPLLFDQFDADDAERHVRLQFEGYPAIQFTGWPSVAVGTFGGRVILVDRSDNGKGQFRILVAPDPTLEFNEDAWPKEGLLRQGMRANGWVFLNRVTLGWEIWRRLNGFPPVVGPSDGKDKDGDKEKVKRKVPK